MKCPSSTYLSHHWGSICLGVFLSLFAKTQGWDLPFIVTLVISFQEVKQTTHIAICCSGPAIGVAKRRRASVRFLSLAISSDSMQAQNLVGKFSPKSSVVDFFIHNRKLPCISGLLLNLSEARFYRYLAVERHFYKIFRMQHFVGVIHWSLPLKTVTIVFLLNATFCHLLAHSLQDSRTSRY